MAKQSKNKNISEKPEKILYENQDEPPRLKARYPFKKKQSLSNES